MTARSDSPLALAAEHGVAVDARGCIAGTDLTLARVAGRLTVKEHGVLRTRGITVDFAAHDTRPGGRGLSRRQPLARAVGRVPQRVVDATAGLGHDAFLLAALGHEVLAFERSPVLVALLEDGLRRAAEDPGLQATLGGRLRVSAGDARTLLPALAADADVVYIDPMYPPKKKSALPPKSIRLVRALVGDDPDAGELLAVALEVARRRVVVKRPLHAPPLGDPPSVVQRGKIVRYDVYLVTPATRP